MVLSRETINEPLSTIMSQPYSILKRLSTKKNKKSLDFDSSSCYNLIMTQAKDISENLIERGGKLTPEGWVFEKDCNLSHLRLKSLPKIHKVGGDFWCHINQLTSLEGCPKEVDGDFYCYNNQLTSLQGSPQKVGGDFWCQNNQLTSLEGCPREVGGGFWCSYNKLTSLQGCPQRVGGDFWCSYNQLTSLKGCPQEVGGNFYCLNNQLSPSSFRGLLLFVKGKFEYDYSNFPKDSQLYKRLGDMLIFLV